MSTAIKVAAFSYASSLVLAFIAVNRVVTEPYMDEPFHIPQAQAYCRGKFNQWDPALTTPPGLYLISAIPAYLVHPLRSSICSRTGLRSVNLIFAFILPFILNRLLTLTQGSLISSPSTKGKKTREVQSDHSLEAFALSSFPIAWFFSLLYYTELGSLVLVLLSYQYGLEARWLLSSLAGAASLWFRQTNIIWLLFVVSRSGIKTLSRVEISRPLKDPLLKNATLVDVPSSILSLLDVAFRSLPTLIPVFLAWTPTILGAAAFVQWNGGIVLGDKSNHIPTLHLVQPLYFTAFTAAFLAPHLLRPRSLARSIINLLGTPLRCISSAIMLAGALYCVKKFTHYTFYVWRRIINRHPLARYVLTPGYILSGRLMYDAMAESSSSTLLSSLSLFICTILVLVPTPLIEPRYFLIPYILCRLHIKPRSKATIVAEAGMYMAVNLVTVWIFVKKDFPSTDGSGTSRFMW